MLATKTGKEDANAMTVENEADEGERRDSEADVERKRIKDMFETFMKNRFSKVKLKNPSDLTKDSSDEGMSTSGVRIFSM